MAELRKTGIDVLGDIPWGSHFCSFYETKQDLLDMLVPYFKTGLESKELCLCIVSNSGLITMEEVKEALAQVIPGFEQLFSDKTIEILNETDWYLEKNAFNLEKVINGWLAKLNRALALGYKGMRVSGDTFWLNEKIWKDFVDYEKQVSESITDLPITLLCTYPLAKSGAAEILDVAHNHQFAITRRHGEWEVLETQELIEAKAEIKKLNEELEQRVVERTRQLESANSELRNEITERKRTEALLHAKEEEFRAIVENAPDHIARYDREFRRTYVNPAFARALDLPAETLIGKPIFSSLRDAGVDVKEDELAQIHQRIQDVFDTGKLSEFEVALPMHSGRRYYSVRFFPELDHNGSVIYVMGIARDITERRIAEEELKKEKEILAKVFDNIPVMIGFVGGDGVVKLVNPEWERTIGWTLKELQEQNVDIFAEAYPDLSYRQKILDFVAASTGEWMDLKIKVRDGRVIDAACAIVLLSDGTRVAIAQDITKRKRAEDALRNSEDRIRLIIDTIPTMAWSILPDGTVDFLNQRWLDYAGEGGIENANRIVHPEDLPGVMEKWLANMAAGKAFENEMRLRRADGEYRWFLVRTAPLRDEQGNLVKWYGVSIDIEDSKRAEETLKQSYAEVRRLTEHLQKIREEERTSIAREIHDELGQQLTAIKMDVAWIDKKTPEETIDIKRKLKNIIALLDGSNQSIRRILSELRPRILDDHGLLEAIEWLGRQLTETTGIPVKFTTPEKDIKVSEQIATCIFRVCQEAFTNITRYSHAKNVSNSIKFIEDSIMLIIEDDGIGFDAASVQNEKSFGILGMKERVLSLGGKFELVSSPGKGTKITVSLPYRNN